MRGHSSSLKNMIHYEWYLVKGPALKSLDNEVSWFSRHQRLIVEGGARLRSSLTETGVQPQAKVAFSRSNWQTVYIASGISRRVTKRTQQFPWIDLPGKVRILSRPVVHLKTGNCSEEKTFSGAVEMFWHEYGGWDQCSEHHLVGVLDTEQSGAVSAGAAASVEAGQTEAVCRGGVDEAPVVANEPSWQVVWQQGHQLLWQYLSVPHQLRWLRCSVQTQLTNMSQWRLTLMCQWSLDMNLGSSKYQKYILETELGNFTDLCIWSGPSHEPREVWNPRCHCLSLDC